MSRLDLLLIHPNGRAGIYGGVAALAAIEPPLWACMLAAYVRGNGHSVQIIDAEEEGLTPEQVAAAVVELHPRLAAVVVYGHQPSASTQTMPAASDTMRAIDAAHEADSVYTMLLGGHVAALPGRTLAEESADFVCTGEGFVTLDHTLRALKSGGDIGQVPGLLSHGQPNSRSGREPSLVDDLDTAIPAPAWDLLVIGLRRYRAHNWHTLRRYRAHNWHTLGEKTRSPYVSLYTSLGCPFDCSFCSIQAPFRSGEKAAGKTRSNSYRRWSPARIGQTLENLASQGVRHVKIADEMFVLNRAHVEGVCDEILRRRLDLNLWAYARTDTVKEGMADKLKAAGFNWLAFGIESGDAAVRDESRKSLGQTSDIESTIAGVRAAGIHVIANYIFGLPGETMESMRKTRALAEHLNTEFVNYYCAQCYPGSALYTETLQNRPGDLPETWSGYSQHSRDSRPLRTEALTSAEILRFRDEAFAAYHDRPEYLRRLRAKFGEEAVTTVQHMLAHKIERNPAP